MQSQASSSSSSVGSREITERLQANLNRGQDAKERELKIETVAVAASVQPSADFKEGLSAFMLGSQEVIIDDKDPTIDTDIFNDMGFSFEFYDDPVVVETGQTYSRKQIEDHFAKGNQYDPLTRVDCKSFDLIPNINFNLYLQEYKCREALFEAKQISYKEYQLCMPYSLIRMKKPVIAADGFTYEEEEIKAHLAKGNNTSPITKQRLPHTRLVVNEKIKNCITNYEQKRTIIHRKELSDHDLQLAIQLDRRYLHEYQETGMAVTEAARRQTENLTKHLRELETEYARRESLYQGAERNSKQVIDRLTLQLHQQQHDYKQREAKIIEDIQSKQQRIDQLELAAGNAVSAQVEGAPAGDSERQPNSVSDPGLKEIRVHFSVLMAQLQRERNVYAKTVADLKLDIHRLQNEVKPINRKDNGKPTVSPSPSPSPASQHPSANANANAQAAVSQLSPHISAQPSPRPKLVFSLGAVGDAKNALARENKQVSPEEEQKIITAIKSYATELEEIQDKMGEIIKTQEPYRILRAIANHIKHGEYYLCGYVEIPHQVPLSTALYNAIDTILKNPKEPIFYDNLNAMISVLSRYNKSKLPNKPKELFNLLEGRKSEDVKRLSQITNACMQYQIGRLYENGLCGIAKDENRAYEWYEKSAAQGYAEALQKIADRPGNKGQRLQS